jgi:hypothetical protein
MSYKLEKVESVGEHTFYKVIIDEPIADNHSLLSTTLGDTALDKTRLAAREKYEVVVKKKNKPGAEKGRGGVQF